MIRLVVYYTPTTYKKEIMGTEEEVAITSLLSVFTAKKCTVFITNNTNSRFFFQFQSGANCVSVVLDL